MSFGKEVRVELARVYPGRPCCRAAELAAVFRCEAEAGPGRIGAPAVAVGHAALARKVYQLLRQSGCETGLEIRKGDRRPQRRAYRVEVQAGAERLWPMLEEACGPLEGDGVPQKTCCLRAYLRGAFLCRGSLSSPEKGYHLEFRFEREAVAASVVRALAALGLEGRRTRRRGAHVVYLKDSEQIVEALKEMGARKAIFEMENVRIVKGMRNRVNRLVNSETANVEKTVNAALAQLEAIRIIDEQVGLDSLPLPLRSLARLRLQHPYASLRELGELLTPKVSKSGVSYRMNQLMDRARKLAEAGARRGAPGGI